jgi:hypothetical protein
MPGPPARRCSVGEGRNDVVELPAGFRHELVEARLLDVTSGDERDVLVPHEGSVYLIAAGAYANDARLHPVVGAADLVRNQGRGSRNFQKLACVFHPSHSPING